MINEDISATNESLVTEHVTPSSTISFVNRENILSESKYSVNTANTSISSTIVRYPLIDIQSKCNTFSQVAFFFGTRYHAALPFKFVTYDALDILFPRMTPVDSSHLQFPSPSTVHTTSKTFFNLSSFPTRLPRSLTR